MNLLVRLAPRGCPHLRGLLSRPAPLDHVWRRSCFFTTERRDPTAALGHFYGESFEVPSLSQGPSPASGTLSRGGDATHQAPAVAPVTVEALVRAETDAEMTVYRIDQALGKPPLQLVLSLDTNRQRTGLAEALLRKLRKLGVSVQCEGLDCGEADWIVLEAHDCMIHIFDPETRLSHSIDEQLGRLREAVGDAIVATDEQRMTLLTQLASSTPRSLSRLRQRPVGVN